MSKRSWIIEVKTDIGSLEYMRFEDEKKRKIAVVSFRLNGPISPEAAKDFAELVRAYVSEFVKPNEKELVALSGRGPIWLFMLIQHQLHGSVSNLGVFDPKVGIIPVAIHGWDSNFVEGEIIKVPDEIRAKLTQ